MAKANGKLTTQAVDAWFASLSFDEQQKVLLKLQTSHSDVRQSKIDSLRQQLEALENGASSATAVRKRRTGGKKAGSQAKYRDPKSGETWSGRGRMARWLADKVKAGENREKYLA